MIKCKKTRAPTALHPDAVSCPEDVQQLRELTEKALKQKQPKLDKTNLTPKNKSKE